MLIHQVEYSVHLHTFWFCFTSLSKNSAEFRRSIWKISSQYIQSCRMYGYWKSVKNIEYHWGGLLSALIFIKKGTLPQVFSCKFCEISKNTFSNRTPPVVASERWKIVKPITLQRTFFTQVTGNRVSDHYARNVYIKVFL